MVVLLGKLFSTKAKNIPIVDVSKERILRFEWGVDVFYECGCIELGACSDFIIADFVNDLFSFQVTSLVALQATHWSFFLNNEF